MLSYQHIYHAGNLADVQKHALLCVMLAYMGKKAKPFSYLETHSGRGLYHLDAPEAVKTGEAAAGIGVAEAWFDADHPFRRALDEVKNRYGATAYGGSPLLAAACLRAGDRMHLAELHPQENAALNESMFGAKNGVISKVYKQDGFAMAQAVCPPEPRRGLMLIDPSYEIKKDYKTLPDFIAKIHRKWNVGVIALWYPVLTDGSHEDMVKALKAKDFPKALCHEVRFPPAREGHRMVGSGMFIVNAPYGLDTECRRLDGFFNSLR